MCELNIVTQHNCPNLEIETDGQLLKQISGEQKTTKRYHKSTRLRDVLVACRDALYSKEIDKEKLDFTTKF